MGEAAHIEGSATGSARHNPVSTDAYRDSEENGIWLCRDCHKLVDRCYLTFKKEVLHTWKEEARRFHIIQVAAPSHLVLADAQPYESHRRAAVFYKHHLPVADAFFELIQQHSGQPRVPVTDALRVGIYHANSPMLGEWGLGRTDYVTQPIIQARQRTILDIIEQLKVEQPFKHHRGELNLSFRPNKHGERTFIDPITQLLDTHFALLQGLLPMMDATSAVGESLSAEFAASIARGGK